MTETDFIATLLDELAAYVRDRYAERDRLHVRSKSDPNDLLTDVDEEVQRRAVARVAQRFPGDLFVAEESGLNRMPEDPRARCWVMDPIDGTQNFVRGLYPAFGVSLAFVQGGQVAAAGVWLPATQDRFLAERGTGAYRNGNRLRTSTVAALGVARVEVDFAGPAYRPATLERARRVLLSAGQIRCHCAAVVGLCSIATGDMDAYVHVSLHPWDYAGAVLVCQEAGGTATTFSGAALPVFAPETTVAASNGRFHSELLAALTQNS